MQATQSSTASGSRKHLGKFAALRHVTREMSLNRAAMPVVRRPVAAVVADTAVPVAGVAEGAGLAHDAGNLLGALSLYSDLLAMPGVLHEEHREYATELRMLSDRSRSLEGAMPPIKTGTAQINTPSTKATVVLLVSTEPSIPALNRAAPANQ